MRKLFLPVLLLILASVLVAPALAQERGTVVDVLTDDPGGQFSTLLAALEAADLIDPLGADGPFTIFAPTNDAFTAALEAMGMTEDELLEDTDTLAQILQYHVVPERLLFRHLITRDTVTTLQGEEATVGLGDRGLLYVNDVPVSSVDYVADNGVVHILDGVLMPPSLLESAAGEAQATEEPAETEEPDESAEPETANTVLDALANDPFGQFSTFLMALEAANLTESLRESEAITVFAPTNDAIAAALETMGMTEDDMLADTDTLAQVLQYHVVPERLLFRHLITRDTVTTLQGEEATVGLGDRGLLHVNDVPVSSVDYIADNGVYHVLEGVLLPPTLAAALLPTPEPTEAPSPTMEPTVEPTAEPTEPETNTLVDALANDPFGQFSTLVAALESAGLAELLSGEGPFTIFAPTNDAIAAALETMGMTEAEFLGDPDTLAQILRYHVVPERLLFRHLITRDTVTTLQGEEATVGLGDRGLLHVNDVPVSSVDYITDNGVYHILEGVLLPPTLAAALLPTPEPTATPEPTDTPTPVPTDTPLPTATNTAVPTDTPEPTATFTPEPTDTPPPTATPLPTDTPLPTATLTPTIEGPVARVRVAHLSPDAPALDVYLNDALSPLQGLVYQDISPWIVVSAGSHALSLAAAGTSLGDALVGPVTFTANTDTWTTLVVIGSFTRGTAMVQPVLEDYSPIAEGNARATVFHAVEGAPAVDLIIDNSIAISQLGYPLTIGNNDGAFVIEVPAGTVDIQVIGTGTFGRQGGAQVLLDLPDALLVPDTNYFIAAIGEPGEMEILIFPVDMALVTGQ